MRIGVVSDTHDNARNVERIVELLNEAGVERVVHTGDITRPRTLAWLERLEAPLVGVFGNNDVEREALLAEAARLGFELAPGPLEVEWAGRRIAVVHDPRELEGVLLEGEHALALHGHNHRHIQEWRNGCLVFNPGECSGHMVGHNAVGIVDLESLEAERLFF